MSQQRLDRFCQSFPIEVCILELIGDPQKFMPVDTAMLGQLPQCSVAGEQRPAVLLGEDESGTVDEGHRSVCVSEQLGVLDRLRM
ncbi:hypothetical protein JM946_17320 [Steroidobacter sp. S1-65]|uniref:Uncharacterized protein n=1 Tax=Steroidobacter gossypii TaxID=2805490 RepID=A0ABS1WZV1_9GAMM|nr:hypothetical protein [Steroidobacter gossypii]MBM0106492.1 hypothetical protein [Steroidobacter gossypii]